MKIRFCEHNKGTGRIFKKLKEQHPELNIKRKDCLKECGTCKKTPFVLVGGKTVKADDDDELFEKIESIIKTGSIS